MQVHEAMAARRSIKRYVEGLAVSDEELRALFESVTLTPSSFNIQHWNFVVVRDAEGKRELMARAWGQPQVGQCSAAIVVVADPMQYRQVGGLLRRSGMPEAEAAKSEKMVMDFYEGKEQLARDEALRSCGMAAMSLMLRATELGYATGPMIGFDAAAVSERLGIKSPQFPAMMIVLGKAAAGEPRHGRPYRRGVSDIVKLESATGRSL